MKAHCDRCKLRGPVPVMGRGKPNPTIMFVGEAPGKKEDEKGEPFVGMSGYLLRQILRTFDIDSDDIYLTNVCKCRPEENRTPVKSERDACFPELEQEIKDIDPKFIVGLGAVAGHTLFDNFVGIHKNRGQQLTVTIDGKTYPGMVTFHPAAALHRGDAGLFPDIVSDIRKLTWMVKGEFREQDHNTKVVVIDNDAKAYQAIKRMCEVSEIAFDWETTGTDPTKDHGFCLGISWKENTAVTWPVKWVHRWRDGITSAFERDDVTLVAFNATFDASFNRRENLPAIVEEDPMYMHAMLDERPQQRNQENLADEFLMAPRYESAMLAKWETDKANMINDVPASEIYHYCGMDADYCLRLYHVFKKELEQYPKLNKLYHRLIMRAAVFLDKVKTYGIPINRDRVTELNDTLQVEVIGYKERLQDLLKDPDFNPNSHPQTQYALWEHFKIPEPDIYGRRPQSADKETRVFLLENLDPDTQAYKFVDALHNYKDLYHQLSRYVRKIDSFLDDDDRIHPTFHLDRSETGRLSATNPPIQQWPKQNRFRSLVEAPKGRMIVKADYSQVEMRMAALYGQDTKLAEMLKSEDFHSTMAAKAFRIPLDEVTSDIRSAAKAVSFGLLYGMSEWKLAESTGLPKERAKQFVKDYKNLMPGVQRWIRQTKLDIKKKGYLESLFGRRRRFMLVTDNNINNLEREGVNFPIQSAASDLTLWAAMNIQDRFEEENIDAHIIILMHDEIVTECDKTILDQVTNIIYEEMNKTPFKTDIPFPVDIDVGKTWSVTS